MRCGFHLSLLCVAVVALGSVAESAPPRGALRSSNRAKTSRTRNVVPKTAKRTTRLTGGAKEFTIAFARQKDAVELGAHSARVVSRSGVGRTPLFVALPPGTRVNGASVAKKRAQAWAKRLTESGWSRAWVARSLGRIVGQVELHSGTSGDRARLGIMLSASARGRGLGSVLLDRALTYARRQGFRHVDLEVLSTNPTAMAMYERRGFVRTRATTVILAPDAPSVVVYGMSLNLKPSKR